MRINCDGNISVYEKFNIMDNLGHSDQVDNKDTPVMDAKNKESTETPQMSSTSSNVQQDDTSINRSFMEDIVDEEVIKKKKRKDNSEKDPLAKPGPSGKSGGSRTVSGSKVPGPASKTTATTQKNVSGQNASKTNVTSAKNAQSQGKGSGGQNKSGQGSHQGKSGGGKGTSSANKSDRKSPVSSPKSSQANTLESEEESKNQEAAAPKVPPLKIVIPGGACGSSSRNEGENDGSGGPRGAGKGRNSANTLPYVLPCTAADAGPASDSSDGNSDDKRSLGEGKAQRVLRSHRTNDDKERTSPQSAAGVVASTSNKSPPTSSNQDNEHPSTSAGTGNSGKTDSGQTTSVDLHPRKRKIKASRETHVREQPVEPSSHLSQTVAQSNPYQMYIQIKKQIYKRQKSLFPVKPKPPKDFNNYLMNRCTYTLHGSESAEPPPLELPPSLPPTMKEEYMNQEEERLALRNGHQVEKEKLVLAVEQEILRVHGRAERAVANQSQPYSVCTILRDQEVYNLLAPEQEEKRNAQRSRCNGRQINSWLQEVDDKWEKIKEGMLKRQHREAETLYASQVMDWEWKLKEMGLCDYKIKPVIDPTHVPQVHVSNFDLPA